MAIMKYMNRSKDMDMMKKSYKEYQTKPAITIRQRLFNKDAIKPLIIGFVLTLGRQFCGMNSFNFYLNQVFEGVGFENPSLGGILFGFVNVGGLFIGMMFIDRLGRRAMLILGQLGIILMLCLYTILQYFKEHSIAPTNVTSILSLLVICAYPFFYQNSLGAIPFFVIGELSTDAVRPVVSSISIALTWFGAVIVSFVTPVFMNTLKEWAWTPWIGCTLLVLFFTIFFIPETKGKSMDVVTEETKDQVHVKGAKVVDVIEEPPKVVIDITALEKPVEEEEKPVEEEISQLPTDLKTTLENIIV
eukprot:CAMPEP_0117421144 /NCGR_PEP_ID=MMETSP0758-20121206/2312_1 /TAXON_ID=63605 /ORGANISM="Percolomonas cosmopolitus, Strain AE-1 (ATCC 50343)" /LENGTH=302 /DNA_ID=CAMNT_0005203127 /DNA_START=888 /DNA_END=1796 /DNA_ORIENTATION=+